jgi:opacity protein-like surface antigen
LIHLRELDLTVPVEVPASGSNQKELRQHAGEIMNCKSFITTALFLGLLTQGRAADSFIGAIVTEVDPHVAGASTATGLGFCTGVYWRTGQEDLEKEVSFEFWSARWTGRDALGVRQDSFSDTLMPLMLNFRVNVAPDSDYKNLRVYFGPSIGMARMNGRDHITGGGMDQRFDDSVWNMVWGGTAGLKIRVTPTVDIDLGYRVLVIAKTTYRYQGQGYGFGQRATNVFSLGVGMRF